MSRVDAILLHGACMCVYMYYNREFTGNGAKNFLLKLS